MVLSTSDVVLSGCTVVFLLLLFLAWQLPQFLSLNRFQVFPVTKEPTFFSSSIFVNNFCFVSSLFGGAASSSVNDIR